MLRLASDFVGGDEVLLHRYIVTREELEGLSLPVQNELLSAQVETLRDVLSARSARHLSSRREMTRRESCNRWRSLFFRSSRRRPQLRPGLSRRRAHHGISAAARRPHVRPTSRRQHFRSSSICPSSRRPDFRISRRRAAAGRISRCLQDIRPDILRCCLCANIRKSSQDHLQANHRRMKTAPSHGFRTGIFGSCFRPIQNPFEQITDFVLI
jgi:hypothetical protein